MISWRETFIQVYSFNIWKRRKRNGGGKTKEDNGTKKLEPGSDYAKYDLDGDGVVTDEELEMDDKMMRLENEDKKKTIKTYGVVPSFGMLCLFGCCFHIYWT